MTLLQFDVPLVATSLRCVTTTAPPQLSDAVTEPMSGGGTERQVALIVGGSLFAGGYVLIRRMTRIEP